jgi:Na+/phosphate symporter
LTESPAVRALLAALPNEVLPDIVVGAVLTVLSYSSLAIVLLTATLADQAVIPAHVALRLVIGANLGSGLLAIIATSADSAATRRLPLGNLLFKGAGALVAVPLPSHAHVLLQDLAPTVREALSEREGRRWTDIVSLTINVEQIGECIERVLLDIEDKKIRPGRRFSAAGPQAQVSIFTP